MARYRMSQLTLRPGGQCPPLHAPACLGQPKMITHRSPRTNAFLVVSSRAKARKGRSRGIWSLLRQIRRCDVGESTALPVGFNGLREEILRVSQKKRQPLFGAAAQLHACRKNSSRNLLDLDGNRLGCGFEQAGLGSLDRNLIGSLGSGFLDRDLASLVHAYASLLDL